MKSLGESFLVLMPASSMTNWTKRFTAGWKTDSPHFFIVVDSECGASLVIAHKHTGLGLTRGAPFDRFEELKETARRIAAIPLSWEESDPEKFVLQPFELDLPVYEEFLLACREQIVWPIAVERARRKLNVEIWIDKQRERKILAMAKKAASN